MRRIMTLPLYVVLTALSVSAVLATAAQAEGPYFELKETPIPEPVKHEINVKSGATIVFYEAFPATVVLECAKDTGKGEFDAKGKSKAEVRYEECKIYHHNECFPVVVVAKFKDQLQYLPETFRKKVVDVWTMESGSTVTIENSGVETCVYDGKYEITGTVGGEATPVNEEVVTGKLIFKAPGEVQQIKEVENEKGELTVLKLAIGGKAAGVESLEEISLAAPLEGEKWGVHT